MRRVQAPIRKCPSWESVIYDPGVVAGLETLEHVDEEVEPVPVDPACPGPGRRADVDADSEHDSLTRLGEDARRLPSVDQDVVRLLDRRLRPDRGRHRMRCDE